MGSDGSLHESFSNAADPWSLPTSIGPNGQFPALARISAINSGEVTSVVAVDVNGFLICYSFDTGVAIKGKPSLWNSTIVDDQTKFPAGAGTSIIPNAGAPGELLLFAVRDG